MLNVICCIYKTVSLMPFYFVTNCITVYHKLDISQCVKVASIQLSSHAFIMIAMIYRYIAQPYVIVIKLLMIYLNNITTTVGIQYNLR